MTYIYTELRPKILQEDGVKMLLSISKTAHRLIDEAGAVSMGKAWGGVTGDSWLMMACVDYLVELGELQEVTGASCWGQHRIFTRPL